MADFFEEEAEVSDEEDVHPSSDEEEEEEEEEGSWGQQVLLDLIHQIAARIYFNVNFY